VPTNLNDDGYEALQASKNIRLPTTSMTQTATAVLCEPYP